MMAAGREDHGFGNVFIPIGLYHEGAVFFLSDALDVFEFEVSPEIGDLIEEIVREFRSRDGFDGRIVF